MAARTAKDEAAFRAKLKDAGLKVTPSRLAVLRALGANDAPVSHAELADRLEKEDIDRVTVWRILAALTEAALVDRHDVGDRTWRFELRRPGPDHGPHPHFLCASCKVVRCLPHDAVKLAPHLARSVTDVQLTGRCDACL